MWKEFQRFAKIASMAVFLIGMGAGVIAQEGSSADPRRPLRPESQTGSHNGDLPFFSPRRPQSCEINRLYVDDAGERVRKAKDSYIIAIGHLGNGERSSRLNRRRLAAVRRFLEQVVSVKAITAEGERVEGYGIVELYVGGQLLYTLPLPRNGRISLGSCEFE